MAHIRKPLALTFLGLFVVAHSEAADSLRTGTFKWTASQPVLSAALRTDDPCYSVKDPSIVRFEGRYHLFSTIRSVKRTHQIEYLSFADWKEASTAPRYILTITNNYFCAPEVFYFTPHKKWYLIYQASHLRRKPSLQPAFSTTENISDPESWTKPVFLYEEHPENVRAWIDFWVICDETKAHLFFTSNNGLMWRAETTLRAFPNGWSAPKIVLKDDIFEASHTYRIKGGSRYLTVVEAQNGGRRYYKAYLADRLDGEWKPLAATKENPFAAPVNVRDNGPHWTDSFSHGEFIRSGSDEHLEIDPANLQFLFQGVLDRDLRGKPYGEIPWQLGLLNPVQE
jgi:hypothetical protein